MPFVHFHFVARSKTLNKFDGDVCVFRRLNLSPRIVISPPPNANILRPRCQSSTRCYGSIDILYLSQVYFQCFNWKVYSCLIISFFNFDTPQFSLLHKQIWIWRVRTYRFQICFKEVRFCYAYRIDLLAADRSILSTFQSCRLLKLITKPRLHHIFS